MWIIGTIFIGAIVGFIARLISPAPNNPKGFLFTCLLGIVGAEAATFLGGAIHWYRPGQSAGFIASIVGAIIVLAIWRSFVRSRAG